MSQEPHFRVSPQVLGPLGAEQLQDPALAVLELIKNAWDADATTVSIRVDQKSALAHITVSDNGHGMDRRDFNDRWLVIGSSHKRGQQTSEGGRTLIGEKGLGRLATFALGRLVTIRSARVSKAAFEAVVDWEKLRVARSLEDYSVSVRNLRSKVPRGTRVHIHDLRSPWSERNTEFLITHAQFLAAAPGQRFRVTLNVNGEQFVVEDPTATISQLSEASLEMLVLEDGQPTIQKCVVNGQDETNILFRDIKESDREVSLAGARLTLNFFRRTKAVRQLDDTLDHNEIMAVLERYQGVRIYRDGINVPPYGLNGDDWAALEKQRTATGGPTLTPGNSQLIGEVHLSRRDHPQFVITAGRSGFTDQAALQRLAKYVQWAVRELGTARRAHQLGIHDRTRVVPPRVDTDAAQGSAARDPTRVALADLVRTARAVKEPATRQALHQTIRTVRGIFTSKDETLRLYAQLASTGIAATSFAHELRAEFDVLSEGIGELKAMAGRPNRKLLALLDSSWRRVRSFATLFRVVPVKLRRQSTILSSGDLRTSAKAIAALASPDQVTCDIQIPDLSLRIVPAELDSILLNLVSNALKAINSSDNRHSGRIRIKLSQRGADIDIGVADNGCGISPAVEAVMFLPLEGKFSEGTGMGLPIVRYIAERYKGAVVFRRPDGGAFKSEFVVTLRNVVQ